MVTPDPTVSPLLPMATDLSSAKAVMSYLTSKTCQRRCHSLLMACRGLSSADASPMLAPCQPYASLIAHLIVVHPH